MKEPVSVDVTDDSRQLPCQGLYSEPPAEAASLEADGCEHKYFIGTRDERPGLDNVEEDTSGHTSSLFDAAAHSPVRQPVTVSRQRAKDRSGDYLPERRDRSAADIRSCRASHLFPVLVVTSSSSSSIGVGRLLLTWLPWLLSMTSLGLATALPVKSGGSRSPVRVFQGSANNADVDGPV